MEKSTNRELWVVFRHPVHKTVSARWFASDSTSTARQKAETFIKNGHECKSGRIAEGAKTAEEALAMEKP